MTTRSAATKRTHEESEDTFDLSRARVVRRGPKHGRPSRRTLRSLRVAAGQTQADVSDATGIQQSELSRIERKGDDALREMVISTVGRIVESLGGRLELVAHFPKTGHRMLIVGHEGDE
ncbi:MAG: helix-turn-helix transcriptional regulator [Polyangiaceae bacterium]|nr:helix-turn-helix transcriptional regulator [Polyangiaceae bacterium]